MKTGIPTNRSMVKNHISNAVQHGELRPVVVPDLSSTSSSGCDPSLSRTLSRQESHCSTSSSSSSSPSTVSDAKTREREDRIESDTSPVTVSTTDKKRSWRPDVDQANKTSKTNNKEPQTERGDPLYSEIPEWLIWVNTVLYSFPERPKLRDLPEDKNYKGTVQKAQWWSQTPNSNQVHREAC